MDKFQEAEFEVKALFLPVAKFIEGAEHGLEEAGEFFLSEERGGTGGAALFVRRDLQELCGGTVEIGTVGIQVRDLGDDAVAKVADALAGELRGRVAGVEELVGDGDDFGGLVRIYGFEDALEDGIGDGAHELADLGGVQMGDAVLGGCAGNGLVHDGKGVTHGAVTGLGEESKGCIVGFDAFLGGDAAEFLEDIDELYGVKAEVLTARADGLRNVFRLGGGHHEDDVVGWLFEGLEERVEGGVGDLMGFVQDVDLVLVSCGTVTGSIPQFADLVDTAVGGGVDLNDVDGVAGFDLGAGFADFAGLGVGADLAADNVAAVERHSKDAGDGCLADAAVAGEDVAVSDALLGERVHQGDGDVVLAGNVGKALRAVLPG